MARPTKITSLVVQKLEEAFALGCSDGEACIYAGICKQTLYNFQEKDEGFLDRKELLKNTPVLMARMAVVKSFKHSPLLAFKYLDRIKNGGFNSPDIQSNTLIDPATQERIDKALNDYLETPSENRQLEKVG